MKAVIEKVRADLFAMQDLSYRDFQAKLIPTIDPQLVIGVRTPELRKYAKVFAKTKEADQFLTCLPHKYYEENNLHGFLLESIKDYDNCVKALDIFLPYVDNWATCDTTVPKVLKKEPEKLFEQAKKWIDSKETYVIRFGIGVFMRFFLDDLFTKESVEIVASVRSEEYYVNMMAAWYFATALAKQYEAILPYIERQRLDKWTHNKAIQKAIESRRLSDEQKDYLRSLKIKEKA